MRILLPLTILLVVALPLAAAEPNPSARQRELIEKLLTEMNISSTTSSMMDAVLAQVEKQTVGAAGGHGGDADAVAEAKELFDAFRARASKIDFAGLMREAYIRIYAKHYTEAELADLNTFYATPTGPRPPKSRR